MKSTSDLVNEYLAKGGQINVLPKGKATINHQPYVTLKRKDLVAMARKVRVKANDDNDRTFKKPSEKAVEVLQKFNK